MRSMKKTLGLALPMLAATLVLGSAAMAKQPPASCERIRHALDSGKSQQQVAKDLKTSESHVKGCTMQQAKTSSTGTPNRTAQ